MGTKQIEDYINKHKKKMNEPIVRNFLESKENYDLFKTAIISPTNKNKQLLDQAFQAHFKKVKVINYVSKLIYYYSMDFGKKVNLNAKRNVLNLDTSFEDKDGNQMSRYEILLSDNEDKTHNSFIQDDNNLKNHLSDEVLIEQFSKLSKKQINILNLFYLEQLTNKEIAQLLKESEQTISYHHKNAIKKLKHAMNLA
ncbi:sigma-70 family RNA polymerase sigma factor [Bacillus cereus group sp. MYBK79-1]|uniref:sigma-70 family RNA polymerase sigma factor n=1 Tax=unclassified Bacillus cereus group TaxID=2750818 RepID=UPI003F78E145